MTGTLCVTKMLDWLRIKLRVVGTHNLRLVKINQDCDCPFPKITQLTHHPFLDFWRYILQWHWVPEQFWEGSWTSRSGHQGCWPWGWWACCSQGTAGPSGGTRQSAWDRQPRGRWWGFRSSSGLLEAEIAKRIKLPSERKSAPSLSTKVLCYKNTLLL